MKISKVVADNFYNKNYVEVGSDIFSVEEAINIYPDEFTAYLSSKKKYKQAMPTKKVTYKPFPSYKKMVRDLLEKQKSIYNKLNFKNITGPDAKIKKSMLIYNYLCKKVHYDMTTEEDIVIDESKFTPLSRKYNIVYKQALKLLKKSNKAIFNKEKIIEQAKEKAYQSFKLETAYQEEYTKAENTVFIKSLYNALINNKGVCAEFSYAYQFLLKGINVKSYTAIIAPKEALIAHAFNLIQDEKSGKTTYYIADITKGNAYFNHNPDKFTTYAFNANKDIFLNEVHKDEEIVELEMLNTDIDCKQTKQMLINIESEKQINAVKNATHFNKDVFKKQKDFSQSISNNNAKFKKETDLEL